MSDAWSYLSDEQHAAAKAAVRLLEDADMRFMMLLFGSNKAGAILANIEPADGVTLVEGALAGPPRPPVEGSSSRSRSNKGDCNEPDRNSHRRAGRARPRRFTPGRQGERGPRRRQRPTRRFIAGYDAGLHDGRLEREEPRPRPRHPSATSPPTGGRRRKPSPGPCAPSASGRSCSKRRPGKRSSWPSPSSTPPATSRRSPSSSTRTG